MADEKNEAPEAFQKFLRASQACLPASNVAKTTNVASHGSAGSEGGEDLWVRVLGGHA